MDYLLLKWLHILSSTFLFGTGIGSAFYMLVASLTRDVRAIAVVARYVVIADWLFTTPAIIIQPVTGFAMLHLSGMPFTSRWVVGSVILYFVAGACWLPVVWMQMRMRDMAMRAAALGDLELPALYWRYFSYWVLLGIPAFLSLVIVFWLMVARPT